MTRVPAPDANAQSQNTKCKESKHGFLCSAEARFQNMLALNLISWFISLERHAICWKHIVKNLVYVHVQTRTHVQMCVSPNRQGYDKLRCITISYDMLRYATMYYDT